MSELKINILYITISSFMPFDNAQDGLRPFGQLRARGTHPTGDRCGNFFMRKFLKHGGAHGHATAIFTCKEQLGMSEEKAPFSPLR